MSIQNSSQNVTHQQTYLRGGYIARPKVICYRRNARCTGQVQDKFHTDNYKIVEVIKVIEYRQLSVKEIMTGLQLKGRDNFLNLYLLPAIADGYVRLLYPDKPRHPRQKYMLTEKGLALYNELYQCKN